MQSQFPEWLSIAARDGRGGLAAEPPAIQRGRTRVMVLNLPVHADFGDWTSGTFAADLRLSPDAQGSPAASYTCVTGTPAGGLTPVTLTLEGGDQAGLPADGNADGVAELFLEVTYTDFGGDEEAILSTRQLVTGAI